jgi:hypothetical protein
MERSPKREPGYRIPKRELVEIAIYKVLDEALTVRSQTLFLKLVMSRLRELNGGGFRLSGQRLRRIAASLDDVDLIIHCREGSRKNRRTLCPVCGTRMENIQNSTLYGWTVNTGKNCPTCSYWTGSHRRIPVRYVFTTEKENYIGENLEED